ncbi:hypothetical protein DFH07DRAFT_965370 [Mycena maculata]|uniref:Uncharacterized protein n=1 Tax=Mycena maculata TaxID=230809 RepID=A0AAD7ICQ7_9AGAR|nr:hypothetical protein DFH07DRAFT_965370 [Mycena maculata]
MKAEEMIPDTQDPARDCRYWCLPPIHGGQTDGRYPMYLVTQGHRVGVWKSWTVTKAMVDGYPGGAQCGHRSEASFDPALEEQRPTAPSASAPLLGMRGAVPPAAPSPSAPAFAGRAASSAVLPQVPGNLRRSSSAGSSASTVSSITGNWDEVPQRARFFAIWWQRIVYGDRDEAGRAFVLAQQRRGAQRILSTAAYEEAQAFSEGIQWDWAAE